MSGADINRSAPVDAQGQRPARSRAQAFLILGGTQFVMVLSMSMLSSAMLPIQDSLGTPTTVLSLVIAAYGMSFAGLLLVAGALVDRGRPRRILAISLSIFACGSVLGMLAPTTELLLAGRFIQGVGAAFAVPAALSLVRIVYPDAEGQSRAMAIWGVLSGLGGIAGILYGGAVSTALGWRWTFAFPTLVVAIALCVLVGVVPAHHGSDRGRLNYTGAVAATLALSGASLALVLGPEVGWVDPMVLWSAAISVGAATACVISERRHATPLMPGAVLRSARRGFALIVVFLASTAITTTYFMLSIHFQEEFGWPPLLTAVGFVPIGVVLFGSSMIIGRVSSRVATTAALPVGTAISAVGLALLGLGASAGTYWALLPGLVVLPVGVAVMFASSTTVAMTDVTDETAGRAGGLLNAVMEAGPTLGIAILVSLGAAFANFHSVGGADVDASTGFSFALIVAGAAYLAVAAMTGVGLRRLNRSTNQRNGKEE